MLNCSAVGVVLLLDSFKLRQFPLQIGYLRLRLLLFVGEWSLFASRETEV